jgi:hypothetical protein
MTKKRRKTLDDALAEEFVYGESSGLPQQTAREAEQLPASQEPEPIQNSEFKIQNVSPDRKSISIQNPKLVLSAAEVSKIQNREVQNREVQNKELSLMEKLQVEPKEVTKRFTVDLPESMHRKLSILAARTGRTKADIVRLLLQDALQDVED